jgi:hypothetical protein
MLVSLLNCSSQHFDPDLEKVLIEKDLFTRVFDSMISGELDSVMLAVPDSGDILVAFGEVVTNTKEEVRQIYQVELSKFNCLKYELVEGPNINFIDQRNCYGTAKIKWICNHFNDSSNTTKEYIISTLFIATKQVNGRWVRVASSQSEKQDKDE